ALVGAGYATWRYTRNKKTEPKYRFGKVERGDLAQNVTATGTLQPLIVVKVGTQVSGTLQKINVDFNSPVKANEVVAQLDPDLLQAKTSQDRANLARAEANVLKQKASLAEAERTLKRQKELRGQNVISQAELDAAQSAYEVALALVAVAEAEVAQAKAALELSQINLKHATITSPIDGVVVSRDVDVGQTVAASLQSPTLFTIANDLTKMQVHANVDEADIGKVKPQQPVTFTVDAFPEDVFKGQVAQIRLNPTTVQNVVTYTVVIDADNPGAKLLPGLTANVALLVAKRENALKAPNAAMRFQPGPDAVIVAPPAPAGSAGKEAKAESVGKEAKGPPGAGAPREMGKYSRGEGGKGGSGGKWGGGRREASSTVYVALPDGKLKPIKLKPGITDGSSTEVLESELSEGQDVIIGSAVTTATRPGGPTPATPWSTRMR
ncbi:MAG: efflux RND transporter periplasmic adaptor subunit, partial [Planctomycetes bacterium]|nr:efflux RND transporter periplasmic adaptor subunit [Planctomycetota bacterium]